MKIGILRETKIPADRRVPMTPNQCKNLLLEYPDLEIYVQPDSIRSFTNEEYEECGIIMSEDLSACDILVGVKEVGIEHLIAEKTYFFFSHTAKKQIHNRKLLQEILKKKITLIDYEYLTNDDKSRIVAFGRWAGIVGAYNGLRAWGIRFQKFDLKPAWMCKNHEELFLQLNKIKPGKIKICVSGGGRVAMGAIEILFALNIIKVEPDEFLSQEFTEAVFCQLDPVHYVKRTDGQKFELNHFFNFPHEYESHFLPFTKSTDLFIACHFWDPRSPDFMTREDMQSEEFKIKIIADVSCDINGPIPSTLRTSTIKEPFYGYNPKDGKETDPFSYGSIMVMAVDNLPGELPRDSSEDFGSKLVSEIFPYLIGRKNGEVINRATIAKRGELTPQFTYLNDFVKF